MINLHFHICPLSSSCSVPAESKPLRADGHANGHANPAFLLRKQDQDHLVKTSGGPDLSGEFHVSRVQQQTKPNFVFMCISTQRNASPRPSPSPSTLSRKTIACPAGKAPPIPAHSAAPMERKAPPQKQPLKSTQRQCSPQGLSLPPFKSEQKQRQAPPPPSGPPPSLCTKSQAQQSQESKHRPDPPKRPPPPCPVSHKSLVSVL